MSERLLEVAQARAAEVATLARQVESGGGLRGSSRSRRWITLLAVVNAILVLAAVGVGMTVRLL